MNGGPGLNRTSTAGFTIIEVMIFLAVSGIIFVSAITSLAKKQDKTEFDIGLGTLISKLQNTIGNVANGYYNLPGNIQCTAAASGPFSLTIGGGSGLGTNQDCIFIGEAIAFGATNGNNEDYSIFPIIARHYENNAPDVESYDFKGSLPNSSNSLATTVSMPYGITVSNNISFPNQQMHYTVGTSLVDFGTIGFFNAFNASSSGGSVAGVQNVELIPIPKSIVGDSSSQTVFKIKALMTNSVVINPDHGVFLCLNSATSNESAQLIIGGRNSPTAINTTRFSKANCQ